MKWETTGLREQKTFDNISHNKLAIVDVVVSCPALFWSTLHLLLVRRGAALHELDWTVKCFNR